MRFLILGCNGMAGHMIGLYLQENGHDVLGFARKESKLIPCKVGDAMERKKLEELIRDGEFDCIVNCIGVLNQFAESNPTEAVYLNAYFPHFLVDLTAGSKTQLIHISTDCVFSGRAGNYTEDSLRDGETFYARSKALGEIEDKRNLTIRTSIVGPDLNPNGIGLLNWFLQQNGEVNGYSAVMWTGQTTLQLAKTIEAAAEGKIVGLYHMVPDRAISKHDLLQLFNHYINRDRAHIIPHADIVSDKSLKRTRFDFAYEIPDYEQMIRELAAWMRMHESLYPHYHL